ncbi:MAG: biotin/lipoyl-containing protein [Saprospiraceae bacterium]
MQKNNPFRLRVNDEYTFEIQPEALAQIDAIPQGPASWHLLDHGNAYTADILHAQPDKRTYSLRINGAVYNVHIGDYYERLIQELGLKSGGGAKIDAVKAPMPGLALQIMVSPGQAIAKGDPLLILEAMKMENVIKASADGAIKEVLVKQGAPVEKGQVLITLA